MKKEEKKGRMKGRKEEGKKRLGEMNKFRNLRKEGKIQLNVMDGQEFERNIKETMIERWDRRREEERKLNKNVDVT